MKKDDFYGIIGAIIIILATIFCSVKCNAQEFKAPAKAKVAFTDTTTTFTYRLANDSVCKVYKSSLNSFYVWRVSKTGKLYKSYLPKEIQKEMREALKKE